MRPGFAAALAAGPVVISSPTGSGKSTEVPRWPRGRVLVVEPRRVACRSLAQRVALLEGVELGAEVGYQVRDEKRRSEKTRILFATPGTVLRLFEEVEQFDVLVLDEFHERGLEVDLLLALARRRRCQGELDTGLIVMSATLEGERLAAHLEGRHLHAEGRLHPVAIHHLAEKTLLPDGRGLEKRVSRAVAASREHPGDVLVFLPGKGEIRACAAALSSGADEILELHGGLSLEKQSRIFEPASRRKVILATNVAETSLTVPGVGVVIDSGLVRRTRYHQGRGFLTLAPIALDSAAQRAGRAGRTFPGVAYRLWSEAAQLEERTPPEIHRESLVPLVMAAAACGERAAELEFLDPPREHALESACQDLAALDALDAEGRLTECGRELFGLPLDAPLGRFLVEARRRAEEEESETDSPSVLDDMIDLVSALAPGRPFVRGTPPFAEEDPEEIQSCDATLLVRLLRGVGGDGGGAAVQAEGFREAQRVRRRLRRAHGLSGAPPTAPRLDRRRLALTVLAADPRTAHVARRRGRRLAFSNGGTEIELGRESAAARAEDPEALVVLESRDLGGAGSARTFVTRAMPVPLAWLGAAGLGRDRLAGVTVEAGQALAEIERVHARRVLETRREVPRGELARRAIAELFLRGSIFKGLVDTVRERLRLGSLARRVASRRSPLWAEEASRLFPEAVPELEAWVEARLAALGVESGADLPLLSGEDLLPPELPEWVRDEITRDHPLTLEVAGTAYEIEYNLERQEAVLRQVRGRKHQIPPAFALPRLPGFAIRIEHRGTLRTLREPS